MLVLSRKKGERIRVGPDIVITVVRLGAQAIRLGIDAPDDVSIVRIDDSSPKAAGEPVPPHVVTTSALAAGVLLEAGD